MKLKTIISIILVLSVLVAVGCDKEEELREVYKSEHFSFTEDMAYYMTSYTRMMLKEEMLAAGVNTSKPLSEQERQKGETWGDYLYSKTVESIENILLYCEAAYADEYTLNEGMIYKADETVSYLSTIAEENGLTAEEYIRQVYGESVTLDGLSICTQMMTLCEGYEIDYSESFDVTEEEAVAYADKNPDKLLKFDALRYTTKDKSVADSLAATSNREDFLKIMGSVSGFDLTDSDKNGTPDSLEVMGTTVGSDMAGEFAKEEGRVIGDTTVSEKDGKYTVTMLLSLPARKMDSLFSFRMLFMSSESSTDPLGDLTSLLEQWKEKEGGEEGFSSLAARYSDDPSAYYGGLYSGVTASEMPSEDVMAWVCDHARAEGDTTVISAGSSGAYMLYYIDGYTQRWVQEAIGSIKADKMEEKIDSVEEGIKEKFSLDEKLMREIVEKAQKEKE